MPVRVALRYSRKRVEQTGKLLRGSLSGVAELESASPTRTRAQAQSTIRRRPGSAPRLATKVVRMGGDQHGASRR
jgi:hypothetical protein